jgi:amino acid transporter
MPTGEPSSLPESATPGKEDRARGLRPNAVGLAGVVFFVVAAAAPLTASLGGTPVSIGFGNGIGAPGAMVLAGLVLLLFAVGYAAMSQHVTNAGAFYAYVSRGLGRPLGLGAAFIALLSYNAISIALYGLFGFFAHQILLDRLGVDLPWQAWAFGAMALVFLLGYRGIDLSAKVLGVLMLCEVAILTVFAVAVVLKGGASGLTLQPFAPGYVFSGAVGVALTFAFANFVGFEATAIYGEESKDPKRTVPRATYIAVTLLTAFYALVAWAVINSYGARAVTAARQDPGNYFFAANTEYVGALSTEVMSVLLVTSIFAALLAFHNAVCRYLFALGRERLLWPRFSVTHPRHRSPYVAGVAQTLLVAFVVGAFALAGADPFLQLFSWMTGLGALGILVLQAGASLAVVGFFRRTRLDTRLWNTLIAPLLGACGLLAATVLVVDNFDVLTGAGRLVTVGFPVLVAACGVAGVAFGLWLRATRPDRYENLAAVLDHSSAPPQSVPASAGRRSADTEVL